MIAVSGLRLPVAAGEAEAVAEACRRCGVRPGQLAAGALRRVSFDARHGGVVKVCSVLLTLRDAQTEQKLVEKYSGVQFYKKQTLEIVHGVQTLRGRPVIVGFGPAGMFAALLLSEQGLRPIVLERGGDMDERVRAVDRFFAGGALDTGCNVQFGAGGAGTFSDGKLTTRINDPLCDYVLETFVRFGAPRDILTKAKPHVGTDLLRGVVCAVRDEVRRRGGEIRFGCRLDDLRLANGAVAGAAADGELFETNAVLLCCGHSARDTFVMLRERGVRLTAKPFSVGFRIEHLQSDVDRMVYGAAAGDPLLPPAEYALSADAGGRCIYTFCMCPGGTVVAAASETGGVVTNGMSQYARDGRFANSAVAVSLSEADFAHDPWQALEFQRELERGAFAAGGSSYAAPAQDLAAFLRGQPGLESAKISPTYPRGVVPGELGALFPAPLAAALRQGIAGLDRRLHGFADGQAVLTGVETRTSSPLRIPRGADRQAEGTPGLYPCGEGAGYAGGIMSAAVDGLRSALAVLARFAPAEESK